REAWDWDSDDPAARVAWRAIYHAREKYPEAGLVADVTSRADPQTLRLALLFALLDRSEAIGWRHLEAATAIVDYTIRSARYLFGQMRGDWREEAIAFLRRQPNGGTTTELREHFKRNCPQLTAILNGLVAEGIATATEEPTKGRTAIRWRIKPTAT